MKVVIKYQYKNIVDDVYYPGAFSGTFLRFKGVFNTFKCFKYQLLNLILFSKTDFGNFLADLDFWQEI